MALLVRCVSALLLSQAFWTVASVDSKLVRKSGKIEMSVSSNGEISGAAAGAAALLETQKAQELLAQVEEMVKSNDPANRDKIKEIMDIVEKLFPDIEFERDQEKKQVGINLAAIDTCNTHSTERQETIKSSVEKQVGSDRGTHTTCRTEEKKKEEHKNGRCGELDTFLNGTNTPATKPSGRDAEVKWVEEMSTYWCPKGPKAQELDEVCKQAEKEHAEHKASCDRSQYTFESAFCIWRTELSNACNNVQTCYDGAVKTYNDHKAIAEDLIEKWKTEWASLKKIRCYIDVWMNDQDTKTVSADKYEECKALEPDTTVMDIDFGKVPAKVTCDVTPVQVHPGTTKFPQVEYSAFSTYAAEPISCLKEVTVGPIAPTEAPTTEAPTTKAPTTTTEAPTTEAPTTRRTTTTAPYVAPTTTTQAPTTTTKAAMLWSHIDCSKNGGSCNLGGVVGSSTWPDCKSGVQHPSSGTNRCWQQDNLDVAKKICEAHDDCVGLTRDNHGWEPRRGPGVTQHVAAHELMMKATNNGYADMKCSGGTTACNLGGVVGSSTWSDCKSGVQHSASSNNRCWQQDNFEVAKKICDNHSDCMGLTRDNHGWEPRRGPSLASHVAAHEVMLKGK